jgi:outer membrane receptor protein involved in Fe transport
MRFFYAFLLCFLSAGMPVALAAQSYLSLSDKVSVSLTHTNAAAVVKLLERQTAYTFAYDPEYLQRCGLDQVKFNEASISTVLRYLDDYAPIDISYANNTVALKAGKQTRNAALEKGHVTGKIVDAKNEPLPGVTILASNGQGAVTSVDGTYDLSLDPGMYTLTFSFVSYETRQVTEVKVNEKGLTPLNIVMKNSGSSLKEVTVTGTYRRASIEGLYAIQKNNAGITDGISAEQIARTPDKNIGEVLKRVSGVATMDNKYVVVRGLSERYNQAVLNGQIMPSTEMNRKNFSFNVIPANMVENITVVKTLTPDRSAEFGGGLIEVNTLDIPTSNFLNISAGGSFNTNTTNKQFQSLHLDGSEYWGKASPDRNLLGKLDWNSTDDIKAAYAAKGNKAAAFSNNWGVEKMQAPLSQNYQLAAGKVIRLNDKHQLGMVLSGSYRNTFLTEDIRMSRDNFEGRVNPNDSARAGYVGKRYGITTNLGALAGIGFRSPKTRIGYQALFLRNFDQQLVTGRGQHADPSGYMLGFYDITTQTDMLQHQLKGEHALGNRGIKFKWIGSYLTLEKVRPDNHYLLAYGVEDDKLQSNEYNIRGPISTLSEGALRWWTRTHEKNLNWDAAVSIPFSFSPGKFVSENIFKAGYAGWRKDRMFYILNTGSVANTADYPPLAQAFSPGRGAQILISNFSDDFHKKASLHSGYVMLDDRIGEKFRLVWGVRAEYYDLNAANDALDSLQRQINQSRGPETALDFSALKNREPNWNFFPSANLTYNLTPAMNLRLAYAKSIIRPDLRELSFFREYDFELGGNYSSNLVKSTIAHHYDFRYEWYPAAGEVLSVSLFYKKFLYSMEIYNDEGSGNMFDLKNNKNSRNYGLEVEVRKSLAFTKVPFIRNLVLYGNFTALRGYVTPMDINYNGLDSTNANKVIPRENVKPEEKRPQTGASNYMVNAGVFYDIKPLSVSLVYNYITNRMFRPETVYRYSLFERPMIGLDGQIAVRFLKGNGEVKMNVGNLLNSKTLVYRNDYRVPEVENGTKAPTTKEMLYQEGKDFINFESKPGRTYSMTISYRF